MLTGSSETFSDRGEVIIGALHLSRINNVRTTTRTTETAAAR